jgi:CRP/FNR family transcriptional regulator, cyclic AMP receptor protein
MKCYNAVFEVTETCSCPLYKVGGEFIMQDSTLIVESDKQVCLILMHELLKALADTKQPQSAEFECGGCPGSTSRICFKRKKDQACSAVQVNQLKAAEQQARQRLISETFSILRKMDMFEPFSDIDLHALALMMKLRRYPPDTIIMEEGERGRNCYVVLSGQAVAAGTAAEIGPGDVFGEMCLLSGEAVYPAVHSLTEVRLGVLTAKDFSLLLSCCPNLQIFFYRMLASRSKCKEHSMPAGEINTSGMSGELSAYINLVDLFQLINTGGKTGAIDLTLPEGNARVLFHEGEIIHSSFGQLQGKEALFALLAQENGSFSYSNGLTEKEKDLPILGGFMGLLLEGLLHLDERRRMKQDGPALS